MDLADSNPQDEMVVHICAFSADVMARLEEDTDASISSFTIWKQDPNVASAWAETVDILEALSTSKTRLRTFDFLDASATALWNSFMRFLQRLDKRDSTLKDSISQVPMLVCRMLECCHCGDDDSDYGSLKLFQVLIKTAEICSGCTMAEEATSLLQQAASTMKCINVNAVSYPDGSDYITSYHFLSARMALKHGEIEDFWSHYSYLPQSIEYKKPLSLGQYASIHLSAFRAASTSGYKELSERLLLKVADAFEFLKQNRQRVDGFMFLISELYYTLAVFSALYNIPRTDSLTEEATLDKLDFSDSFKKLKADIQQVTEKELEGPLGLYLRLEIMCRLDCIDPEAFHQTLSRYIESFEPTKDKFKRCLQYVIRLRDQDFNKGMICLRLLYRHIDHFVGDQDWVHQNFVALLRLVPSPCCPNSEALRFLTDLMTNLQELSIAPLSTAESDAALIILRKQIESAYSECSFLEAQAWCHFCRNKIFCNASRTNESIFLRKMMDCSYRAGDYAEVKSTWEQLLLRQARDPTGLHMMYQISLRDAHVESAASFLAVLTQLDQGEHRYALAAVAVAITVSSLMRQKALQSVYEFLKHYVTVLDLKPENVDLHRVLVRLVVYELREHPDDAETLRGQLCEVFDWVIQKNNQKRLNSNDLDWFARCSFMILLEASRTWSATEIIRILNMCIEINDTYHEDAGTMVQIEIQRRQVCCGLIGMLIYASLARKEEDTTKKRSFYHEVLRICPNFHDSKEFELSSRKISFAESISSDITEASHEIMCFHLEAALHLERWPEVEEFVHAMCRTEDDKVRAIMTDMILTSNLPIDSIIRNLTVILDFQSSTNANRLIFVRSIFDLCIQHCRSDIRVCELVLDRARIIAQDIMFATEEHNFDEEIEHISTVSFNYAVDLHLADQVLDSERWAYKAIELSENMKNDGGDLTGSLKAKHDQWITYVADPEN